MSTRQNERDGYARELTGFERRLLDDLHAVHAAGTRNGSEPAAAARTRKRPARPRWRPALALAGTAAVMVAATVLPSVLADRSDDPAGTLRELAATAQAAPVSTAPVSYAHTIAGTRYVSLTDGVELYTEVRSSQESWLPAAVSAAAPGHARAQPHELAGCEGAPSETACAEWLPRHAGELGLTTAPIDVVESEFPYHPAGGEPLSLTHQTLFPGLQLADGQSINSLPTEQAALDRAVREMVPLYEVAQDRSDPNLRQIADDTRLRTLLRIVSSPAANPALRSAAYSLAETVPGTKQASDDAVDRLGRRGIKLTLGEGEFRHEVIVDPAAATVLSWESFRPVPPQTSRPAEPVVTSTFRLFVTTAGVSKMDEVP